MIKLSKDNANRQLSIHGWLGLITGFLLYIIVFTGTVVVFMEELNQWSISGKVVEQPLSSTETYSIDSIISSLIVQVPKDYRNNISVHHSYQGYLEVTFSPNAESPVLDKTVITNYLIDPRTSEIISQGNNIDSLASSWVRFIRTFHTDLYIPGQLGRWIVGLFGMILMIATISGLLIHRHLIKDLFLAPRSSSKSIEQKDKHNLAGTWSLPFALLLGLTGAVICFDSRIALPAMVVSVFQGDVKKAMDTLLVEPDVDKVYKHQAPLSALEVTKTNATIDSIIQSSTNLVGIAPNVLRIKNYAQEKSLITTYHPALDIENDIFYHKFLFNGQGDYIKELGEVGDTPTVSSRSLQLVSTLHYGNFAGWLSKLIWFVSSGMLCYVIITGFKLWFEKRIKEPKWQRLYPSVPIMIYGVPISLMTAGFAYFISYTGGITIAELDAIWIGFGIGWLICMLSLLTVKFNLMAVHNTTNSLDRINRAMYYIRQYFYFTLSIILFALPLVRWQSSQIGWSMLIDNNNGMVVIIDVFFIIVGLLFYVKFLQKSVV